MNKSRWTGETNLGEEFIVLKDSTEKGDIERQEVHFLNKTTGSHDLVAQTTNENKKQKQHKSLKGTKNTQEKYNNICNSQSGGQRVRSGEAVCDAIGGKMSAKLERRRKY
jgi:hypothetical protein